MQTIDTPSQLFVALHEANIATLLAHGMICAQLSCLQNAEKLKKEGCQTSLTTAEKLRAQAASWSAEAAADMENAVARLQRAQTEALKALEHAGDNVTPLRQSIARWQPSDAAAVLLTDCRAALESITPEVIPDDESDGISGVTIPPAMLTDLEFCETAEERFRLD